MESGVFEAINSCSLRFENSSTKFYRFRPTDSFNLTISHNSTSENEKKPCNTKRKSSEIITLKKMLDNLRERPKTTLNDRHNCSK